MGSGESKTSDDRSADSVPDSTVDDDGRQASAVEKKGDVKKEEEVEAKKAMEEIEKDAENVMRGWKRLITVWSAEKNDDKW